MQTEFNKFEEKVDMKFVNSREELLQVNSKLNTPELQRTDKLTTELDKFQAYREKKFVHFNEELTDFKSTVTEQLDTKFKLVDDKFKILETNILSRVDFFEYSVNVRMDCIDDKIKFWMIKCIRYMTNLSNKMKKLISCKVNLILNMPP